MQETITFKKLKGKPLRNIGTTGQAGHWRAMSYEIDIMTPPTSTQSGERIHQEVGHFLMKVDSKDRTHERLRADIIRQATIPRANAMMTNGDLRIESIKKVVKATKEVVKATKEVVKATKEANKNSPDLDFYSARPVLKDPELEALIKTEFSKVIGENLQHLKILNLRKPLDWLARVLDKKVAGTKDWVFSFRKDSLPSQMASGQRVANPVSIGNLLSDFWTGDRKHEGKNIEILQYAQKVNLRFDGEDWPHVAVNTLIKQ